MQFVHAPVSEEALTDAQLGVIAELRADGSRTVSVSAPVFEGQLFGRHLVITQRYYSKECGPMIETALFLPSGDRVAQRATQLR